MWKNIHTELQLGFVNKVKKTLKAWHALILITPIILFSSLAPNASTTIISAEDTGWNAILNNNELSIEAVNPMIIEKTEVCVLWVKQGMGVFQIAKLPDGGSSKITLIDALIEKFPHSTIMISIEDKNHINKPTRIEYQHQL
ncbi:hypothetical protein CRYPA_32 [uncultured Candidatus Thioglobus sp.]|nr:hypothetical protein CRYPA_32 [uncultured Candidatus Thioglobus sp.]